MRRCRAPAPASERTRASTRLIAQFVPSAEHCVIWCAHACVAQFLHETERTTRATTKKKKKQLTLAHVYAKCVWAPPASSSAGGRAASQPSRTSNDNVSQHHRHPRATHKRAQTGGSRTRDTDGNIMYSRDEVITLLLVWLVFAIRRALGTRGWMAMAMAGRQWRRCVVRLGSRQCPGISGEMHEPNMVSLAIARYFLVHHSDNP